MTSCLQQFPVESPLMERIRIFNELEKARDGWFEANKDCCRGTNVNTSSEGSNGSCWILIGIIGHECSRGHEAFAGRSAGNGERALVQG